MRIKKQKIYSGMSNAAEERSRPSGPRNNPLLKAGGQIAPIEDR